MLYDLGSNGQEDVSLTSHGSAITDHVPGRPDTFLYGIDEDEPLSYKLVLCAHEDVVDDQDFFNRWEIAEVAAWLCGHDEYKYLTITQPDMTTFRYRCIITDMKVLTVASVPWAFQFTVTCDSPFAYSYPEKTTFQASTAGATVTFDNRSSRNRPYCPVIELTMTGTSATIVNVTDSNRTMQLTGLPTTAKKIRIDCANQVITDVSTGLNLYPYSNFVFLRLLRGDNTMVLTGDFTMTITTEFPMDVGA